MKYKITSRFLEQESFRTKGHSGIDFLMKDGEPLRAVQDGIVTVKDFGNQNAGLTVKIKMNNGQELIYGHLEKTTVHTGDVVHSGDLIGYSGHSGHVVSSHGGNGAHLHFGLKGENGKFIDPSPYIDKIQNMNNPSQFVQMSHEVADKISLNGMEFIQQFTTNFIQLIKLNFIDSFDYLFLIQISQQILQTLATHSSFFYDIIRSIF